MFYSLEVQVTIFRAEIKDIPERSAKDTSFNGGQRAFARSGRVMKSRTVAGVGMTCSGCSGAIERILKKVPRVLHSDLDAKPNSFGRGVCVRLRAWVLHESHLIVDLYLCSLI